MRGTVSIISRTFITIEVKNKVRRSGCVDCTCMNQYSEPCVEVGTHITCIFALRML